MSFGTVAAQADPLRRGLVGWYRMLGDASDSSGKGNTGTAVNSPTLVADKYGNASSAYSFDAASSKRITLTQTSGLPLYSDGSSFSITMWVNSAGASPSNACLYGEGNSGTTNPILFMHKVGTRLAFYIRDSSNVYHFPYSVTSAATLSTATVFDSNWHHVAITVTTGTAMQMYVDGAADARATDTGITLGSTFNRSTIAALTRTSTAAHFTGSLSDVRLYNRALTAAEVGSLYRATQRI